MSLVYSDLTNYRGILQQIEQELGFKQGDITGSTALKKHFTAKINLAWDDYLSIAIPASGKWQFDDSNHTDYPIIKTNLVSGQRDYTFSTDEGSNLILDIYKVMVLPSATATTYDEIFTVDQQQTEAFDLDDDIAEESAGGGVPNKYDKTANAVFLDPVPNYNATSGLKVYINREPSYFTTSDTTKKPGCPGNHHRYFVIKPAYDYARANNKKGIIITLRDELIRLEKRIEDDFSRREKDVITRMTPEANVYE